MAQSKQPFMAGDVVTPVETYDSILVKGRTFTVSGCYSNYINDWRVKLEGLPGENYYSWRFILARKACIFKE